MGLYCLCRHAYRSDRSAMSEFDQGEPLFLGADLVDKVVSIEAAIISASTAHHINLSQIVILHAKPHVEIRPVIYKIRSAFNAQ